MYGCFYTFWKTACGAPNNLCTRKTLLVCKRGVYLNVLTSKECPAMLPVLLIEVAARAHKATDHGGNGSHKEYDG